jgi:hypothetical protein
LTPRSEATVRSRTCNSGRPVATVSGRPWNARSSVSNELAVASGDAPTEDGRRRVHAIIRGCRRPFYPGVRSSGRRSRTSSSSPASTHSCSSPFASTSSEVPMSRWGSSWASIAPWGSWPSLSWDPGSTPWADAPSCWWVSVSPWWGAPRPGGKQHRHARLRPRPAGRRLLPVLRGELRLRPGPRAVRPGAAHGFLYPGLAALVTDRTPESRRGAVVGTFSAVLLAGQAAGAFAFVSHAVGYGIMWSWLTWLLLLGFLVSLRLPGP